LKLLMCIFCDYWHILVILDVLLWFGVCPCKSWCGWIIVSEWIIVDLCDCKSVCMNMWLRSKEKKKRKKEKKKEKKKKRRETEGRRQLTAAGRVHLYLGLISLGTSFYIRTGWDNPTFVLDALYGFNNRYKWGSWTDTNACFSSSG
jgi:hypothetical protein